jgi:antitoxin component of MazEF toxin-antitoxin module
MSIEMLQSQIDNLKQEIDYLKDQIRELKDTIETIKPAEPESLLSELQELRAWKESALAVDRQWDPQALAVMLGARPGDNVRAVIQREVTKLIERVKQLEGSNMLQLPWDKAPEWAQWAAMDADGEWAWYSHEPSMVEKGLNNSFDQWLIDGGTAERLCRGFSFPPCTNWKESKRKRP